MTENKQSDPVTLPDEALYVEEEISYTRKRRIYPFLCSLDNCPYCENKPQQGKYPKRKWCSEGAREEFRRRQRAHDALEAGRVPGKIGNPLIEEDKLGQMGVFFIHSLDKLPFVYRIAYRNSWGLYTEDYLNEPASQHDFDAILIVRTPLADILARKIVRKFEALRLGDHRFRLDVADVRIAHQMVIEHLEAHRQ